MDTLSPKETYALEKDIPSGLYNGFWALKNKLVHYGTAQGGLVHIAKVDIPEDDASGISVLGQNDSSEVTLLDWLYGGKRP